MNEHDRKWAAANIIPYKNFDDFIKRGLKSIPLAMHFMPQYKFLCLPNSQNLLIDFLGFYENLQEDFQFIKNKLSVNENLTLRHENKTVSFDNPDYRENYTDETRNIVAEVYKKDIELLGYNFDNSSLKSQLANRSS